MSYTPGNIFCTVFWVYEEGNQTGTSLNTHLRLCRQEIKQSPARCHHYNECKPDNLQEVYHSFPFQKLVKLSFTTCWKQLKQVVHDTSHHLSLGPYTLHHPASQLIIVFDWRCCWLGMLRIGKWHTGMSRKWKALISLEILQRNIMDHYTHLISIFLLMLKARLLCISAEWNLRDNFWWSRKE